MLIQDHILLGEITLTFIADGHVSLVESNKEIPIRILRDTGAVDSFILESI